MLTEVLVVDPVHPEPAILQRAAHVLLDRGLVAFPTETVYGLGALADDAAAIEKIYTAKGRPSHNPLIAHVTDREAARACASAWPALAGALTERFWPGPLTIVVPRRKSLPPALSAGGDTVALRAPNHPVALALLREVGRPLAAPSANRSTKLSPTRAQHVLKSLAGRIELVLDAGPCSVGIESTVVDLTCDPPQILRPGGLSLETLRTVAPQITARSSATPTNTTARSPGLDPLHYAPTTPLSLVSRTELPVLTSARHEKIALLTLAPPLGLRGVLERTLPNTPEGYAAGLFEALHELDELGVEHLLAELPPEQPGWEGVLDRLRRASAPRGVLEGCRVRELWVYFLAMALQRALSVLVILLHAANARAQRPSAAPSRAPAQTVVMQLGSLRVPSGLHRGAVMHAIARDAWPALTQCVQTPPSGRGFTEVELRRAGRTVSVRLSGGPTNTDATLRDCISTALARVSLPPVEGEENPSRVSFQLAFNVPPLPGT